MFKLGGKTNDAQGTGITSGLDTPRSNYLGGGRTIGGGAFTGTPMGNRTGFQNIYESIDVSVPESTRKRAFWSGIGQGFGNNPRTLGEALNTAVGARDKILGPAEAAAAERQFEIDKGGIEKAYDRETAEIITKLESENDIKVAEIQASSTATAQRIKQLNLQFTKNGVVDRSNAEYQRNLNEIIRGFSKTESANKLMIAILNSQMANNEKEAMKMAIRMILGTEAALLGNAYGGKPRSRYQLGATNQGCSTGSSEFKCR